MKLQTVGRGDQQKKGAFFPGKAFRRFPGGNDGVVGGNLFRVPDRAFQAGIRLARKLLQAGDSGKAA